jgi:hypothetical protein
MTRSLDRDPDDPLPTRPRRGDPRDPVEPGPQPAVPVQTLDPEGDLPGEILMVPNRDWLIPSTTSTDHPGVCIRFEGDTFQVVLLKGTDADHVRTWRGFYFVQPTRENGLGKLTAFQLAPRRLRLHRVRVFYPERRLGRVEERVLLALRDELARLHPED